MSRNEKGLPDRLKSFVHFYMAHTFLNAMKAAPRETLMVKLLSYIKYSPFFTFIFFGSSLLLTLGLGLLIFISLLITFEGTSDVSDAGLLTSGLLILIAGAIKLSIFVYIDTREKKVRSLQQSLQRLSGITGIFIGAFAKELREEQKRLVSNVQIKF